MIRAVVDPSVFVSAFIGNPDAGPGRLVEAWRDRRFVLIVSPLLLAEHSRRRGTWVEKEWPERTLTIEELSSDGSLRPVPDTGFVQECR